MKLRWILLCLVLTHSISGQLNVELLSTIDFDDRGGDVWGYNAPDGREYALIATLETVTIVDISDPYIPDILFRIPQQESVWRDIKIWKDHAYVVADQPNTTDGVLVIDLSELPNSITSENKTYTIANGSDPLSDQRIERCHNLYIDENGYVYLVGCSGGTLFDSDQRRINEGGMLIFDAENVEGELEFVAKGPEVYAHDIYVRDNKAYNSEIYEGHFSIYDVTNKQDIINLGGHPTPSEFTHNAWPSDDGKLLFTTDELANAFVGAYDISDPANVRFLDSFRPRGSLGLGTIPHNVHVWKDWLVISYYTDGCVIVDASDPRNLVEVGNYDTYPLDSVGFKGAWGAYPFFDSENIIVGDIESGLFVLGPEYKKAAKLEGVVYDAETGETINAVAIEILEKELLEFSKTDGYYGTGTANTGTYTIKVSRTGYRDQTLTVELVEGQVLLQDFYLQRKKEINLAGRVRIKDTTVPIEDVEVILWKDGRARTLNSNVSGQFDWPGLEEGTYWIIAAKWGYRYNILGSVEFTENQTEPFLEIELEQGYEDLFSIDMGWESEFSGTTGEWWRSVPIGTVPPGLSLFVAPDFDSSDKGARAYVTGHSQSYELGLLKGRAVLTSPTFDVTDMTDPYVRFRYWYWATDASFNFLDQNLRFYLDNGLERKLVKEIGFDQPQQISWEYEGINIKDHMEVTADMRLLVEAMGPATGAIVEAGLDEFRVIESASLSTEVALEKTNGILLYPNPTSDLFTVSVADNKGQHIGQVRILDLEGKLIHEYEVNDKIISLGEDLQRGIYILEVTRPSGETETSKFIKAE